MTLRVTLLRHLPGRIYRRSLLYRLSQATADAFGSSAPDWRGSQYTERLTAYAQFTATEAARLASPGAPTAGGLTAALVGERLYRNAADLGAQLRRRLGIRRRQEALAVLGLLYRQIGIDISEQMTGGASGGMGDSQQIEVTRCFFADHYSPSTCRVMSALDAGVVDGLFGGARLQFSQRITESGPCCRAVIRSAEVQP